MNSTSIKERLDVFSSRELLNALVSKQPLIINIRKTIELSSPIILPKDFELTGTSRVRLIFKQNDGIGLTNNNTIQDLAISVPVTNRAIFVEGRYEDLGILTLKKLKIQGQVQLLTHAETKKAQINADQINLTACDARKYEERPNKYNVSVYQGAFTLYNYSSDASSAISATLLNISIGAPNSPVLGCGILVSGFSDIGGSVKVDKITTGPIYSNSGIPTGTSDLITGAVFIAHGASVDTIINEGNITCFSNGINNMILDAWGSVRHWITEKELTSYGFASIGFVNFGKVGTFKAKAKIETFGEGARGYNQFDGTLEKGHFEEIITHGNAAMGIQLNRSVGDIEVNKGITTFGSVGNTLVEGKMVEHPANAISIQSQGAIKSLKIGGNVESYGANVTSFKLEEGGSIERLEIVGKVIAHGADSLTINLRGNIIAPNTPVKLTFNNDNNAVKLKTIE